MAMGSIGVMAGIPSVLTDFLWSYYQMIQYNCEFIENGNYYIHYDRATYSDHAPARNSLVNKMKGDWLLQLDTDHVFQPDLLRRMLHRVEKYDVDVLVGLYQVKMEPYCPVMWVYDKKDNLHPLASWDKNAGLLEIGAAGAGALFVKRKVYERIKKELGEEPFSRLPGLSEDHSFFRRLHKLDIKAYCDPRIQVNHLRIAPVTLNDLNLNSMAMDTIETPGFK